MTDVRREVVLVMAGLGEARTAYQILDSVNQTRIPKLSAISLYRVLEFLMEVGVVLKLESKNAFELCHNAGGDHSHLMMICDKCGHVEEVDDHDLAQSLSQAAQKHGHRLKHNVIELHGLCRDCLGINGALPRCPAGAIGPRPRYI